MASRKEDEQMVVHCKKEPFDVYIGRPSKWGNPFSVRQYGRDGCLDMYREWLSGKIDIGEKPPTKEEIIKELKGKVLGCWCKPPGGFKGRLLCHGQILVNICSD